MTAEKVSVWLAIIAAIATGAARFASLEESKVIQEKEIADMTVAQKGLEERIGALERDRALLERIHGIELRLGAIEAQRSKR